MIVALLRAKGLKNPFSLELNLQYSVYPRFRRKRSRITYTALGCDIGLPFQDSKTIAGHRCASEELAGNSGGHLLPGGCTLELDAQHHTLGLSEQKFRVAGGPAGNLIQPL